MLVWNQQNIKKKTKNLKELKNYNENKNFANAVLVLNEKVQESILSNAKLLYSNKTLGDASLNDDKKIKLLKPLPNPRQPMRPRISMRL